MTKTNKKWTMAPVIILFLLFPLMLSCHELKTLILIIATDDKPAYVELQKIWESYMSKDPLHFEAYFIKADPNLSQTFIVKPREIWLKTTESFAPGILNKSILAMEAMQERLKEFDYVIRTNLSSFFPYENLLKYLEKLPKENCYAGIKLFQTKELGLPPDIPIVPFVSGANIILSKDMVELLLKDHQQLEKYKADLPDDVWIGLFYHNKHINITCSQRWDYPTHKSWLDFNELIEDHAYHFRAKANYAIRTKEDPYEDELLTLKALVKRYYSIVLE